MIVVLEAVGPDFYTSDGDFFALKENWTTQKIGIPSDRIQRVEEQNLLPYNERVGVPASRNYGEISPIVRIWVDPNPGEEWNAGRRYGYLVPGTLEEVQAMINSQIQARYYWEPILRSNGG